MSVTDVTDKLALLNTRISGIFESTTVKIGDDVKSDFGTGKVVTINDNGIAIALDKWTSVGIDAPKLVVGVSTLTLKKTSASHNNNDESNDVTKPSSTSAAAAGGLN